MTDEELIRLIQKEGYHPEGQALPMLYERWGHLMKAYFSSQGLSLADAEDVLSETFVKIWRSASSYDGKGAARSWLWSIARNTMYDCLRRMKRDAFIELDPEAGMNVSDWFCDPEDLNECVNEGLERFARHEPDRAYVLQLLVLGTPVLEIADRMGRSYAAIRTYMSESRKKLAPYIEHCLELLDEQ